MTNWDFGTVDGRRYSYARDVATHGSPTFAFDEIGWGNSSHSPSDQVTIPSAAFVAHQIVQAQRNGSIAGIKFGKVIIVGHAFSSAGLGRGAQRLRRVIEDTRISRGMFVESVLIVASLRLPAAMRICSSTSSTTGTMRAARRS